MDFYQFLTLLFFTLISSCSNSSKLEQAFLISNENHVELENVLTHYSIDPADSLKYCAACLLVENLPRYFSCQGPLLDSIKTIRNTVDPKGVLRKEVVRKWSGFNKGLLTRIYDAEVITAAYLIQNIDHAFRMWESRSWNKDLTFEEFCELLLPYRLEDEPLEEWRELYEQKFSFLLDSIYTGTDVIEAANVIGRHLRKEGFTYSWDFDPPHLGAHYLLENRVGKCQDIVDFGIYVLRSLGIPAAVDYYPFCSETRSGHPWIVIRDTTGHYTPFPYTDKDTQRGEIYADGRIAGKIYRKTFGRQPVSTKILKDPQVPSFFKYGYHKDVSANYFNTSLTIDADKKEKYAYLGVFSRPGWTGIDITEIKRGKATFENIEPGLVYAILYSDGSQYRQVGYPFFFDGTEKKEFIPDLQRTDTVKLFRKHPLFSWIKHYMSTVVGGVFDVSYHKDFKNASVIYQVPDTPAVNYNVIPLLEPVKGRYLRYRSDKANYSELAEIHVGYQNQYHQPVAGHGENPATVVTAAYDAYDNDPLTYFISDTAGAELILDFGEEVTIDRLMYMPRNDDNYIRIGDEYELFYHGGKDGWISLGKKVATEPELIYDNMPFGALFYLRNRTRGVEEQVFHIENSKQVFISKLID